MDTARRARAVSTILQLAHRGARRSVNRLYMHPVKSFDRSARFPAALVHHIMLKTRTPPASQNPRLKRNRPLVTRVSAGCRRGVGARCKSANETQPWTRPGARVPSAQYCSSPTGERVWAWASLGGSGGGPASTHAKYTSRATCQHYPCGAEGGEG
jgi:hypothetical protein